METQSIDPKVVVAEWIEEAALGGSGDVYDAKRANMRYNWYQQMEMLVDGETVYIQCRDIGTGGIGVSVRKRLEEHSDVKIRRDSRDPWIPCKVAHCTQAISKSIIGLQLDFTF